MEDSDSSRPSHPLPEGITDLTEDETVCRFCGISYLVHREVSSLKDQLGDLQKVLKHYEVRSKLW